MPSTDVVVVGLGALGSATLHHLARASVPAVGIDRYAPPHDRGSSHGRTRIYRQAYYEAPEYVPLALRALELWRDLERESGRRLFVQTGALTIGSEYGELFGGAHASARQHGIAHEVLSVTDVAQRFPVFRAPNGTVALFEPTGGVLFPELCIETHLALAKVRGAEVRTDEQVIAIDAHGDGARVTTDRATYEASRVVVAAGAWAPKLLGLERALTVTRETVHWFAPGSPAARAGDCPVAMIELDAGPLLYTLPDFGDGFKAGLHHAGRIAESLDKTPVAATDADAVANALRRFAPGGAGTLRESAQCFYTTTRDHHFAIGALPAQPAIILASACSGHGFKFASALGELIARMVAAHETRVPTPMFNVERLFAS